ncbi:MAG TPA: competence/damage-inducible protein A, partial [Polyangiaceae bacterium]
GGRLYVTIRWAFGALQGSFLRNASTLRITPGMTVALLGIGTELSRGDLANGNGTWLARELTDLGFEVTAIDVVDDDATRIEEKLRQLAAQHSLLVSTGGLGPTTDDLTTACVANVLKAPLELHDVSVARIVERLARHGRTLTESNKKQAYFPKGAHVLPNDWGTAPGFMVKLGNCRCYFLPGVPSEMREIFAQSIVPELGVPAERTPHEQLLRTFGLAESTLNDKLSGIEQLHRVTVGYRVRFPEIDVKIHARDVDPGRAASRAAAAAREVFDRLGAVVYGVGDVSLPKVVGQRLLEEKLNLGVAESCTGGLLASLVTEHAGASAWFRGGVVAYANGVKTKLLDVNPGVIAGQGAVSEAVASTMAIGACTALEASVGIGITGIAGPEGGSESKPVGTVCFGFHGPFGTRCATQQFAGDRQRVQRIAAFYALSTLLSILPQRDLRSLIVD